jgi:cytochrome c-type biogenesis protein
MTQLSLLTIFGAGLLTFASPCVLPLLPVHLSVLAGASVSDLRRGQRSFHALTATLAFGAGLVTVFVVLGLVASTAGRTLFEHRALLQQLGGLAVVLFGLRFIGWLQIPWLEREARPLLGRAGGGGIVGGFFFGVTFALGWTPCVSPILGTVLMVAAGHGAGSQAAGALDLAVYGAGLVTPLVLTAAVAPLALAWHRRLVPHVRKLELATGVLLALFGVLLLTDQLGVLTPAAVASPAPALARAVAEPPLPSPAPGLLASLDAPRGASCTAHDAQGCALPDVSAADATSAPDLVGDGGEPRLVEFVARTCPICQRMEPVLRAAESDCTGRGLRFLRVDVGESAGRKAADLHHVRGVPTFLMLDASGAEVARLVGEVPLGVLRQSLEVLAGQKCDGFRAFER